MPRKEDGNQEFWTCNGMEQRQVMFCHCFKSGTCSFLCVIFERDDFIIMGFHIASMR